MNSLLYSSEYPINDKISLVIPKISDIIENEDSYYGLVSAFTAMPIDMMVQLDDIGIKFTDINEFELFLILFSSLRTQDTSLILKDIDLSKFELGVNQDNDLPVLIDTENDIVIDRGVLALIANGLRKINHLEKDIHKPGNKEAYDYMLKKARKKLKSKKKQDSQLESLIIAMVNTPEYKYDFESTKDLSIYQFNESVRQIVKKVDFNNKMYGVYAGTIDAKKISQDELNWLIHK